MYTGEGSGSTVSLLFSSPPHSPKQSRGGQKKADEAEQNSAREFENGRRACPSLHSPLRTTGYPVPPPPTHTHTQTPTSTPVAIVWRREERHARPFVLPVVPIHDELVSSAHERETVRVVELFRDVLSKRVSLDWAEVSVFFPLSSYTGRGGSPLLSAIGPTPAYRPGRTIAGHRSGLRVVPLALCKL